MDAFSNLSVDVPSYVLVPEESSGVDVLEDLQKVRESGIELAQFRRTQRVRFGPMRFPTQLGGVGFKRSEESSIRDIEAIWPGSKEYDAGGAAEEDTFPNLR